MRDPGNEVDLIQGMLRFEPNIFGAFQGAVVSEGFPSVVDSLKDLTRYRTQGLY